MRKFGKSYRPLPKDSLTPKAVGSNHLRRLDRSEQADVWVMAGSRPIRTFGTSGTISRMSAQPGILECRISRGACVSNY